MDLARDKWDNKSIMEFQEYLKILQNEEKKSWLKNLLKTKLPVLCIKSPELKNIAKEIYKGNYVEFLDFMIWEYYENTAINGYLINRIKDFDLMKKYLDKYSIKADNWATCDLLKFNVKGNEEKYYNLTLEYIKSKSNFVRRIGILVLFNFINNNNYIDKIFKLLDKFENEEDYYVNMMNSWLLCECYIKQKDKTLVYLNNNKLNRFTINKAIQKCRDSYRLNDDEKNMLLQYKRS